MTDEVNGAAREPSLEAIRLRALGELKAKPKVRAWWHVLPFLWSFKAGVVLGGVALFARGGWVGNTAATAQMWMGALALCIAVMAASVVSLAPRTYRAFRWLAIWVGAVIALVLCRSGWDPGIPVWKGIAGCFSVGCLVSVPPLIAMLTGMTRFYARPGQVLAAGLAAGGVGALVLHLHCPNGTLVHLLAGHLMPAVLVVCLVWSILRLLPARSFSP